VAMALTALMVCQVHRAWQEPPVLLGQRERLDRPALMESMESTVPMDYSVQRGQWVRKDYQVWTAWTVPMAPTVCRAHKVFRVLQVQQDLLVRRVLQVLLVLTVMMVTMDRLDLPDPLVPPALLELLGQRGHRVFMVRMA